MTDERPSTVERRLRYAEWIIRLGIAVGLFLYVGWSLLQEPSNDKDWQLDAVRLGLFLTAILVLLRVPGVRWPPTKG